MDKGSITPEICAPAKAVRRETIKTAYFMLFIFADFSLYSNADVFFFRSNLSEASIVIPIGQNHPQKKRPENNVIIKTPKDKRNVSASFKSASETLKER